MWRPVCLAMRSSPTGARVRFATPRDRAASATIHHVETRTTVLLVDDHPSFRACARAILEADGFTVIGEAEDGQGALRAIDSLSPDVVLLDVQLPDMDGFTVLERLGTGAPPVVLISSRDACDYDGMIRGSGARGFISKAELSGSAIRSLLW
jgi:DNA-binding NarL/FixJ family response regulator